MAPNPSAPSPITAAAPPGAAVRPRRRRRRLVATFGLALVLAGSLVACGADTGGDDVASLATGDQAGGMSTTEVKPLTDEEIAEAQEAFQACMQEHGVDIEIAGTAADGSDGGGMIMRTEGGGPGEDPPEGRVYDAMARAVGDMFVRKLTGAFFKSASSEKGAHGAR